MIELKNVYKSYYTGKVEIKALEDVSLTIDKGEFVAIMGPSGSGKSTLLHIVGLLDRPDKGSYILNGIDVSGFSEERLACLRNEFIGFVFQQFHLLTRMSALENVALPLVYCGKYSQKQKAIEKIRLVGLTDRLYHKPNELSGGQQQRVAIARALVNEPLIILADEPTGNLDTKSEEEIMGILSELHKQGKTIIVVTHEPEIARYAKRLIRMRDGKIISDQPTDKIRTYDNRLSDKKLSNGVYCKKGAWLTKFLEYFRQAIFSMTAHKLRTGLSILGILIGVSAVIAMLALGEGAKQSVQKELASLGSNLLNVQTGSFRSRGIALEQGVIARLNQQDLDAIKKISKAVKRVSPRVSGRAQIVYQNHNWNTLVEGVGVEYALMRASVPVTGRFFTEQELRQREKIAVLGVTVATNLFGENNPVGKIIKINQINFRVIGVLPAKGFSGFRDQDDTILIPYTTAMYRLLGKQYFDNIFVEASSSEDLENLQQQIRSLIVKQHRLTKNTDDAFEIRNMAEIRSALESTTKTMTILLGSIAAISLLVGGIGIMNIMLVSVTERTREIGLRKAIGANNEDIMAQFLIEALLLSLIGGILGIFLGSGISFLLSSVAHWTVRISFVSIAVACFFSISVGVIFGLWPARQAAQLDPIQALRYE
ncbi:MAG: ABC transporter permease [Candidatus Omnitrophica bacterium]|nr:ABC transporter permease [Candidatus Omnitrophota bacterium]